MIACPSAATLAQLGADPLRDGTLSTLEGHIQGCSHCQAALDRLVRNDAAGDFAMPQLLPGQHEWPQVPGFVIERELGRGSMSVVYLARQPSLGRLVALKVVRSGPSAGSREYARWLREGRSYSAIRHDNVVRLHDVGQAGGWLYLVLEYVPGGTLNDRLDVPYAGRDAARLMEAISLAVAAIHGRRLLHLDLKPSNILMDALPDAPREQATPRVGDFGLAYSWDDPDATANAIGPTGPLGTPRYMAPEQIGAGRESLGPAADVYGLGALLYHVMTGRPPFVAPSVADTLEQVRHQEPVPPRRLNPAIPRDLETICLKCLQKEPARRYGSARAVADELRRFLDGVAIAARPVSTPERTWRWCRRRPVVAALALSLAFTLLAGFLGMFLMWRHAVSEHGRANDQRGRAEAAQIRAEADFRRLAEILDQMVELSVGGPGGLPKVISPEHKTRLLQDIRRQLIDLGPRLPNREAMLFHLMAVNDRLSLTLSDRNRWDEVKSLLEQSLAESEEAIRQFPRATFARGWQARHLGSLASVAERQQRTAEREAIYRQAIAAIEAWAGLDCGAEPLSHLIWHRRALARALVEQGRHAEARDLLVANRRSLEECPGAIVDSDTVVTERVLSGLDFHHLGLGPPPAARLESAGPPDPVAMLGSPEADRLPAELWAKLAARALRIGDGPGPRPATYRESAAAYRFTRQLQAMAWDQRNRHRLPDAVQTADRFVCLARLLVERNPNDPAAHLVLADAYDQVKKNAWQVHDWAAIEQNLRRSIDENAHALDLAPYDEVALHEIERRRRKLDEFVHGRQNLK